MAVVINFVIDNYIWFMIGVIIILFAIIGRYADKTNFGEGKKIIKVKKKDKDNDIIDSLEVEHSSTPENQNTSSNEKSIDDSTNSNNSTDKKDPIDNIFADNNSSNIDLKTVDLPSSVEQNDKTINEESTSKEPTEEKSIIDEIVEENKADKEELNELLPEKDILDDDLFQDLGELSDINFNSKEKKVKDIPDLDDVVLPDITSSKKSSKQIWNKK